jgi:transposase
MRKGFDALSGIVRRDMGRDPLSGEVFIFMNRSRATVKLLHWERGGPVLYHKRLEKGRFSLPVFDEKSRCYHLQWRDLVLMTEGISLEKTVRKKRFESLMKTG